MVASAITAAASAYGALKSSRSSSPSGSSTQTSQVTLDPRMQALIYGDGTPGNTGITGRIGDLFSQRQSPGIGGFGNAADAYLGLNGSGMLDDLHNTANILQGGNITAPMSAAAQAQYTPGPAAAQVQAAHAGRAEVQLPQGLQAAMSANVAPVRAAEINAPNQNSTDLSQAYQNTIYGNPAENPYLTGAIQSGINQSNNAFQSQQIDSTNNLLRNILPSIRSNSILSGQYGGSRQGIAEGNALGQFGAEQQRAIAQQGQHNTDAAVSAQAGAYDAGQNRALSALTNLSGQQYGVASNDAQMQQQAALQNQQIQQNNNQYNASNYQNAQSQNYQAGLQGALTNAGYAQQSWNANADRQQQASLANAGYAQQAGQAAADRQQQVNLANAGYSQQSGLANQSAQIGTNQLNSANRATGLQANSGLLGSIYGYAGANDSYNINRTGQISGLLTPYTGLGAVASQTTPLYSNPISTAIGGATAGLGLYNAYNQATNGNNNNFLQNNSAFSRQGLTSSDLFNY